MLLLDQRYDRAQDLLVFENHPVRVQNRHSGIIRIDDETLA